MFYVWLQTTDVSARQKTVVQSVFFFGILLESVLAHIFKLPAIQYWELIIHGGRVLGNLSVSSRCHQADIQRQASSYNRYNFIGFKFVTLARNMAISANGWRLNCSAVAIRRRC